MWKNDARQSLYSERQVAKPVCSPMIPFTRKTKYYKATEGQRPSTWHPFYHSGSFFLSFPSYLAGGKIIILLELNDPKYLLDAICEEKVNNGWVTVPTMSDSINAIKKGVIDITEYDFSHVTGSIVIGAQPVPFALFEDMKKILPFKTGNIYGITEGGGGGLINLYDEDVLKKPGSIGKPTFNVEARIVDESGKDVAVGEVGELILRGPRNMKEYFRNPDMTGKTMKDGWLYTETW